MHEHEAILDKDGAGEGKPTVDVNKLRPLGRLGGNTYCRVGMPCMCVLCVSYTCFLHVSLICMLVSSGSPWRQYVLSGRYALYVCLTCSLHVSLICMPASSGRTPCRFHLRSPAPGPHCSQEVSGEGEEEEEEEEEESLFTADAGGGGGGGGGFIQS